MTTTHAITTLYSRSRGRGLEYRIRADRWGGFRIHLGDKELLRSRDPLTENGCRRSPNPRKATGAVELAKAAIESLRDMNEF